VNVRRLALVAFVLLSSLGTASSVGAANECEGLMVCVSVPGQWVVVPAAGGATRPAAEWQLTCPRGHTVGGLDARLSERAIEVSFLGALGSPVTPGVTTARSVVFRAAYTGTARRSPTFKPFIGCIPAAGGGGRVPTSVTAVPPGRPTTRRVQTARVRPGTTTVAQACTARERLVGASHAFAFSTRRPPSASLVASVTGTQSVRGNRVVVRARGDAELAGIRVFVQVHAVCAVAR
jgi:hypothetical protein